MSTVKEAAAQLEAALKTVQDVRHYTDLGAVIDPPATVLGPPSLTWDALYGGPTSARFLVYLIVAADNRGMERLWELVPVVAAALDDVEDAVVIRADPSSYLTGGGELPCYSIQVDVSL